MEALRETALVKASQKGNKQAFEELIRIYYPYVSGFLLKMTCDAALTEDLTQESFLKMIQNIDRFHTGGNAGFGTWLITIARNCYIDYYRKFHVVPANIDEFQPDDPHDMAGSVMQKMQYFEVLKAIETLPPEQGLVIRLKYEEDLTLAEIAGHLGIPQKTVKSRIHEGTVKLRKILNITGKEGKS